jgi:hypothetical protein
MTAVAGYLAELTDLLWPAGDRPGPDDLILLPSKRAPRLLVPVGRRAGAAALRTYGEPGSVRSMLATRALAAVIASGMGGVVLRDRLCVGAPSIQGLLSELVGQQVQVSLHLRADRANRKPVLQLLTRSGETVGFAKIGVSPLTSRLVRAERDALMLLSQADLASITIPQLLHYGVWHGLDVLVLSALPTWERRRPVTPATLAAAMRELAAVGGLRRETLAESGYLERLRGNLATADQGPEQAVLMQELDSLAPIANATMLSFGSWHGDWAPWNMAYTGRGLMVWDWERFTSGVPEGFDALHYWLQTELKMRHRDSRDAAARVIQDAPQVLSPFGIDAAAARVTAVLYLADLATRYLVDRQAEAGSPLGAPGKWLLPAITGEVARLAA